MKLLHTVYILLSFCFVSSVQAEDLSQVIEVVPHATVRLPSSWKQISDSDLDRTARAARQAGVTLNTRPYSAFQRADRELFSYPYVTVTWNEGQHVAAATTQELIDSFEREVNGGAVRDVEKQANGYMNNTGVGGARFDEQRHIFSANVRSQLPDRSFISAKVKIYFLNDGMLQLNFYTNSQDMQTDSVLFEQIANSVQIDEGYGYNPIGASTSLAFLGHLSAKSKMILIFLGLSMLGKLLHAGGSRVLTQSAERKITKNRSKFVAKPATEEAATNTEGHKNEVTLANPKLPKDDPLIEQLKLVVEACSHISVARLFDRCDENAQHSLVMTIDFPQTVPLKEQQRDLKTVRDLLKGATVANVLFQAQIQSTRRLGAGLVVVQKEQAVSQAPKVGNRPQEKAKPIELKLDL